MDQTPKLELKTNVPTTVTLKYVPTESKDYGYGATWKYTVVHDGVEKIYFFNERQYSAVKDFKRGDSLVLEMREEKNEETGKTYKRLIVKPALFDDRGNLVPPAPPDIAKDPVAFSAYRDERVKTLAAAIEDVIRVKQQLIASHYEHKESIENLFTGETVQDYAVSLWIEENKRR